jgi:hypothetical protein
MSTNSSQPARKLLPEASSSIKNRIRKRRSERTLRVSPAKIIKAEEMLFKGHTQREVGRTLHMSTHTVARVVKTEHFQDFIREQRERLFGLASVAIESVQEGLSTDPHLAYAFLKDLGIIPSRDAMMQLGATPSAQTSQEEREERQRHFIAAAIQERHRVFEIELPDDIKEAMEKA